MQSPLIVIKTGVLFDQSKSEALRPRRITGEIRGKYLIYLPCILKILNLNTSDLVDDKIRR